MRVWAFPSFYPYDYPGMRWAGPFAHRQYVGLINNGVELNVIIPVKWNPPYPFSELAADWKKDRELNYPEKRINDGVTVYHPRIANMKPNRIFGKSFLLRYVDAVKGFFAKNNITLDPKHDIFYSQWLPESVFVQAAARELGVKSVILGVGDDVIVWPREGAAQKEEFRKLVTTADLMTTNADYLGREMQKILGEKIPYKANYFGVDYNKFKPVTAAEKEALKVKYNIPQNRLIILTVGSPLVRKGWLDLFDALAEVKKEHKDFLLVGVYAGPKDLDIEKEAAARGLTDNFYAKGEIHPDLVKEFYNMADIFCLPSHWEGLATVVSESMASGIPVITTNVCGHPEIIDHNVTGILIDAKDVAALKKELLSLIESEEKRTRIATEARKFIVNTWGNDDTNSGKLARILQDVLDGKKQ